MIKSSLYLFICLLITGQTFGQKSTNKDSLLNIISISDNDTLLAKTYIGLTNITLGSSPNEATDYIRKAIQISKRHQFQKELITSYSLLANLKYIRSEHDSSRFYLRQAYKASLTLGDTIRAANCLHNLAIINHATGRLDSALAITRLNTETFIKLNDSIQLGNTYNLMGNVYVDKGYKNIALSHFYKALAIHEKYENKYLIAEDLLNISIILHENNQIKQAVKNLEKAILLYDEIGRNHNKAQAINFLGSALMDLGELERAKSRYLEALKISETHNYRSNIARSYKFLGQLAFKENNNQEAITYFNKALEIYHKSQARTSESLLLTKLSEAYLRSGKNSAALAAVSRSISIAKENSFLKTLSEAYLLKSNILQKMNRDSESLINLRIYNSMKDSLFSIEQQNKIDELIIIHETEKKEAELNMNRQKIMALNQDIEISNLRKGIYGGGFIAVLFILILVIIGFRQKLLSARIQQEAKEKMYRQKLEFKKRALATQTLHLVQKNTFIQNIAESLEKSQKSESDFNHTTGKLLTSLKLEPELDKDWETFKSYFTEVHREFDSALRMICPNLNENDMRLAYLLKMKLSSHEIATMLHVLPESIRKSKYRLKKKLGLNKEQDLYSFLVKINADTRLLNISDSE